LAVICRQLESLPAHRGAEIGTSAHVGHEKTGPRTFRFPDRRGRTKSQVRPPAVRTYASSTTRCSRPRSVVGHRVGVVAPPPTSSVPAIDSTIRDEIGMRQPGRRRTQQRLGSGSLLPALALASE